MTDHLRDQVEGEVDSSVTLVLTPELQDTLEALQGSTPDEGEAPAANAGSAAGWSPGMEVAAHLTLCRMLADGGMGSVWVARHAAMGEVAVKLVSRELLVKHPSIVDRLIREAAALTRLSDPRIVRIFEHGTAPDGTPYIVMELLEGVTLWRLIRRRGPLNLHDTTAVIEQVASALSEAHAHGIIHRDIKPQNIFLTLRKRAIEVKVIDFGIAKEMEVNEIASVTKSGVMVGTPHFMSPEQLLDPKSVDARSDLWSLGVVVYFALTRRLPFAGETLAGLFANITAGKYQPPSALVTGLAADVDRWMAKALSRDVKHRFRTVRELAVALKACAARAGDATATTEQPPPPEVPWLTQPAPAEPPAPPPESKVASTGAPPPKELLPYPHALMVDYTPAEAAPPTQRSPRQRLVLLIGGGVLCIGLMIALLLLLT